jgi:atypical dual specificity phosphatase
MSARWLSTFITTALTLGVVGCSGDSKNEDTAMQHEFSWVIEDQLAGMPRPGTDAAIEEDVAFLKRQKIDLLVSLTTDVPGSSQLAEHDIESLHIPVHDFQAPTMNQIVEFVDSTSRVLASGGRVGVHCTAGMGRTGTMLATYLVYEGSTTEDAIAKIRELRPGSIETVEQEEAIRAYYEHLRGR